MQRLDDHHGVDDHRRRHPLRRARRRRRPRRGFTLVEAVAATAVLGIAAPTLYLTMTDATRARAVEATRAITLAEAVLGHVLADAGSADPALGFDALANAAAYEAALRTRTDPIFGTFYSGLGLTWSLTIEPVTTSESAGDWTAVVNTGATSPQYRRVTASVAWTDPGGAARTLSLAVIVADLS